METPLIDTSVRKIVILPDLETLSREAAAFIIEHTKENTASKGKFAIALSGGSTPGRLYGLLGDLPFKERYPAGLVQPVRGCVTWLIDEEAAGQLEQTGHV